MKKLNKNLNKYERAYVLSIRSTQLELGARKFNKKEDTTPFGIAKQEMEEELCPVIIL